jgi:hypothetical protein
MPLLFDFIQRRLRVEQISKQLVIHSNLFPPEVLILALQPRRPAINPLYELSSAGPGKVSQDVLKNHQADMIPNFP